MIRPLTVLLLAAAVPSANARAQTSNAQRMGELAVGCVAPRTAGVDTVTVTGPDRLPFVRSAVIAAWHASGITVYEAGANRAGTAVQLAVQDAGVRYAKADDGQIERTVRLDLLVRVTGVDGIILADETCGRSESDLVHRDVLESLEDPTWPETVAEPPPPGFFSRILKPVVVTAATAVGIFLFFSLRSRRSDDGG